MIERRTTSSGQVRYEVRLRAPDGRERSRTFRSKAEAKAYEAAEVAKRARGEWIDPRQASIAFEEVAAEWLESNPAKRASTWVRDEMTLRLQLLPHFATSTSASTTFDGPTPRAWSAVVSTSAPHRAVSATPTSV